MRFRAGGETTRFIDNKVGYLLYAPWERLNKKALDVSGSVPGVSCLSQPLVVRGCVLYSRRRE